MESDFGLLVDFLRNELDASSSAKVRQRLETDEALFAEFEKLRRTYAVLRSMPVLSTAEGPDEQALETPARDLPLTEPREEFVRDARREFKARSRVGAIPFIAAQTRWIKTLRQEFALRATVGSIPMLEVRPEFASSLRKEFQQRQLVASVPGLDASDRFKRRLKIAVAETERDDAETQPPNETGLPAVDASDPFRRRLFKQILLSSRRSVRETPTRVDVKEYEWGREIRRGWKQSRRSVAFTMALHAIAIGALLFVFTNNAEGNFLNPTIAKGEVAHFAAPPQPDADVGDDYSVYREPAGTGETGLGDWNSYKERLPVGLGGELSPQTSEIGRGEETPPSPDHPRLGEDALGSSIREDVAGYFRLRGAMREKKIQYLGSAELYDALDSALSYLQRMQEQDGYWGHVGVPANETPRTFEALTNARLEMTSAAVLAYLGDGHNSVESPLQYDWNVRRGINWIISQQTGDGQIGPAGARNVHVHAMATLVLAEDFGMTRADHLREPLRKACRWLCNVSAENSDGFPYQVGQGDSMTTSVWAYMALATADRVRVPPIDLPQQRIDAFLAWYSRQGKYSLSMTDDKPVLAQSELLPTAGAAALNLFAEDASLQAGEEFQQSRRAYLRKINREMPDLKAPMSTDRGDMRYMFFGSLTQALHLQRERRTSNDWRLSFTRTLLENQNADGSYSPGSEYGSLYGHTYATAMAALSIENAYRVSIL